MVITIILIQGEWFNGKSNPQNDTTWAISIDISKFDSLFTPNNSSSVDVATTTSLY